MQWAHRVGVRMLEWAHGKFQDSYESVCSGYTEWVCECLSGQVPRRGSERCHIDAARDHVVGSSGVAAVVQ